MTSFTYLPILLVHWIADFILQSDTLAKNKSSNNYILSTHVLIYSATMTFVWMILLPHIGLLIGAIAITFITHWITDYYTSRWTTKLFLANKRHDFFVVIGLDQFIHTTTLFLTYDLLKHF